jgi:hypothetical protein
MTRWLFSLFAIAPVGALAGCLSATANLSPAPSGWAREELRSRIWSGCGSRECRNTLRAPSGPLRVTTRLHSYGRQDIKGWGSASTSGKIVSGIVQGLLRRQGLTTERQKIGLGTHIISDSGATVLQLRCSVYWIDDEDVEYNRKDSDHVTQSVRRSEGADCRLVDAADTGVVRWRLSAGIAPPRDSLAAIYDSIAAVNPSLVSANPPLSLVRLAPDGTVDTRYTVTRDSLLSLSEALTFVSRLIVERENGAPLAVIHTGLGTVIDLAPDATAEESRVLRLVAALMAVTSKHS